MGTVLTFRYRDFDDGSFAGSKFWRVTPMADWPLADYLLLELVYGYATWPLRQRLPLWASALAFLVFSMLMYLAVVARDRVVDAWGRRQVVSLRNLRT